MATFPTPTIRRDRPSQANEVGTKPAKAGLTVDEFGFGPLRCTRFTFENMTVTMTDEAGVVLYGGQKIYDFPQTGVRILAANADLELLGTGNVTANWDGDFAIGTATATNTALASKTAAAAQAEQAILPYTTTPQADASKVTTANGLSTPTATTQLTDSSAGTADGTIEACTDLATAGGNTYTDAAVNAKIAILRNWAADFAAKINSLARATNQMGIAPMVNGTSTAADLYLNFIVDDADHNGGGITVTSGTVLLFWINCGAIFDT